MADIKRILLSEDGHKFYVKDLESDYHMQYGLVKKEDLCKNKVVTNKGKELFSIPPNTSDIYRKMKRGAQIIPLKDVAIILAETGVTKETKIVDAGVGSGALALFLSMHAKKVFSYDIRDDHIEIAKTNMQMLGIKNCTIKKHNIYEGIPHKEIDVITLDVPEPWLVVGHADKALKQGGFIVSYSPCIPQTADFVNVILKHPHFIHVKTIEINEREWEVEGRKVRPVTRNIGHSGFISICRKVE